MRNKRKQKISSGRLHCILKEPSWKKLEATAAATKRTVTSLVAEGIDLVAARHSTRQA